MSQPAYEKLDMYLRPWILDQAKPVKKMKDGFRSMFISDIESYAPTNESIRRDFEFNSGGKKLSNRRVQPLITMKEADKAYVKEIEDYKQYLLERQNKRQQVFDTESTLNDDDPLRIELEVLDELQRKKIQELDKQIRKIKNLPKELQMFLRQKNLASLILPIIQGKVQLPSITNPQTGQPVNNVAQLLNTVISSQSQQSSIPVAPPLNNRGIPQPPPMNIS